MNSVKRVTSYDVANEAGVSQSAVSRVFLKGRSVSEKTREKVMAAAKRMNYKPNAIARMLITKTSGMVAVILSSSANLNYPEVLSQLNKKLTEKNKRVLLFNLDSACGLEDLLEQIWTYQVDGVIALAAHFNDASVKQFKEHNIPVVLYNRNVEDQLACSICCNHELGISQLIDLLLQNKHEDFLVISGPSESDVGNERRKIALKKFSRHGFDNVPVCYGDYSYQSGRMALREYTRDNKLPTAVVAGNDTMALGVIDEAIQNLGLRVPEDISVVGFDGIGPAEWYSYQLTTVRQPIEQMTKAAIDILLEHIENPDNPVQLRVLAGELIEGKSVAKANKS